ncbi:MAG: hypothetical protein ABI406_11255 [Ktedonobacteraceae bacterium]
MIRLLGAIHSAQGTSRRDVPVSFSNELLAIRQCNERNGYVL